MTQTPNSRLPPTQPNITGNIDELLLLDGVVVVTVVLPNELLVVVGTIESAVTVVGRDVGWTMLVLVSSRVKLKKKM